MKTEIFNCDKCGRILDPFNFHNSRIMVRSELGGNKDYDLCPECRKAFDIFMTMEAKEELKPNNHGIERMTFGSK